MARATEEIRRLTWRQFHEGYDKLLVTGEVVHCNYRDTMIVDSDNDGVTIRMVKIESIPNVGFRKLLERQSHQSTPGERSEIK